MSKEELKDILDTMKVPELRKDLSKKHNIKWLARNLLIQNSDHEDITRAIELIRRLLLGD